MKSVLDAKLDQAERDEFIEQERRLLTLHAREHGNGC